MWHGASRCTYVLLAAWFAIAGSSTLAQPTVELYWNPANRADTVVDFGVTTIGNAVPIKIAVENTGSDTVAILPTDRLTYYAILDIPGAPQIPDWKLEFSPVILATPFVVAPGSTGFLTLTYLAQNLPSLPEETLAEVLLELKVVHLRQPLGPWVGKTFRLKGIKTTRFVSTSSPTMQFDSVYVRPAPAPRRAFRVDNVTNRTFPVVGQFLIPRSSVVDSVEFRVDTLVNASFGPKDVLSWNITYQPRNVGFDSAEFQVVYQPNVNTPGDTVVTRLSGVGVQQRLEIVSASDTLDDVTIQVRGDTVDFGTFDAGLYDYVDATIIVQNTGNTNILMDGEQITGRTSADTSSFQVIQPLIDDRAVVRSTIRTNEFDTLRVRFAPVGRDLYEVRYRISTDLRTRSTISGVPEDAQFTTFVFRGRAIAPRVEVLDTAINFRSIPLLPPGCEGSVTRTVRIRNTGSALLTAHIDLDPPSAPVTVDPIDLRILPDSTALITVRYAPAVVAQLDAWLVVSTNARVKPRVHLTGECREPDTVHVSVADSFHLRPGTILRLPVRASARDVALAQRGTLQLTYDPSVLQYLAYQNAATATAGATIQVSVDGSAGRLSLSMVQPQAPFIASDTLVLLEFATFVGRVASTELRFGTTGTSFGTLDCPNALAVDVSDGRFSLDSLCGLSSKLVQPRGSIIRAGVFPNPMADQARVTIASGREQLVTLTVVDAFGRVLAGPLQHLVQQGLSLIDVDVRHLPPGAAYLQVRANDLPDMVPVVVPVMVQR